MQGICPLHPPFGSGIVLHSASWLRLATSTGQNGLERRAKPNENLSQISTFPLAFISMQRSAATGPEFVLCLLSKHKKIKIYNTSLIILHFKLNRRMSTSLDNNEALDASQSDMSLSFEEPLQDGALRHMKQTGFLAQIKGEIANYLFTISKQSGHTFVIPERTDEKVLSEIYAYLHWAGLRSTAATLLSEAPVEIDVEKKEEEPRLASIFKDVKIKDDIVKTEKVAECRHSGSQTDLKGEEDKCKGEDAFSQTSIFLDLKTQGNQTEKVEKDAVNTGSQTELKLEDASNQTDAANKKSGFDLDQNLNLSNKHLRLTEKQGMDLLTGSPLANKGGKILLTPTPSSASVPPMEHDKSFDFIFPTPRGNDNQLFGSTSTPLVGDLSARMMSMSLSSTQIETPAAKDSTFTVAEEGPLKTFLARNVPQVQEVQEISPQGGDSLKDVVKEESGQSKKEDAGVEGKESEADISTSEAISFSLDEDNDNTLDISLSSLAKGVSDCDLVLPIKGSWKSEGN